MAVAKLKKLLIIAHKSDEEILLKKLQKAAVVEIRPYKEKIDSSVLHLGPGSEYTSNVKKVLEIFDNYKEGKKIASKAGKLVLKKNEYERILRNNNFEQIINDIPKIEDEINIVSSRISETESQLNQLNRWITYRGNLEDIKVTDAYTIKLGKIKCRQKEFEKLVEDLNKKNVSTEKISRSKDATCIIIAYHNENKKDAEECLGKLSFEESETSGYNVTIEENISSLKKSLQYCNSRRNNLISEIGISAHKYEKSLIVYLNYLENNIEIENAINTGFSTESVSFYTAWVKEIDRDRVFSIIGKHKFTRAIEIQPEDGEEIPTVLENKPLFRPFEIVINLYGVPKYFEIDPTPLVSIFFAAFFGLCLTDAGYGIILMVLSLIFAFRMKGAKNFLMLMFYGGIFTIVSGIVFNGWFGDLPAYLGIDKYFLKFAILGDPINTSEGSMNFFRLALLVGVIQIVFALFVKFFDSLKRKDFQGAFFDAIPWILIISSLIIMFLSTKMAVSMQLISAPLFPAYLSNYLIWAILPSALVIILFSARNEKSWGFRLLMGFLNLTIVNGLTSYLGDFLSYIRLMALGLVTAGIAVAVNKIAFQTLSIPAIGFAVMIIILIFGHTMNIAINVLGGFVHTLRLQYVEFFQKFYKGGGRPFKTLEDNYKYIKIVD